MVIGCGVLLVDVMWFHIGHFDVKIFHVTIAYVLFLSSCMACFFFFWRLLICCFYLFTNATGCIKLGLRNAVWSYHFKCYNWNVFINLKLINPYPLNSMRSFSTQSPFITLMSWRAQYGRWSSFGRRVWFTESHLVLIVVFSLMFYLFILFLI